MKGGRAEMVVITVVDPRLTDAQTALGHYFDELDARFRFGFDPNAGGAESDADAMSTPSGAFVVMHAEQSVVGCGGLQRVDDVTAEIKRMWIHSDWRGLGLAGRLLAHLESMAAEQGRTRVVLDTNEALIEAITMYRARGYTAIDRYNSNPYAHHWFAKDIGVTR